MSAAGRWKTRIHSAASIYNPANREAAILKLVEEAAGLATPPPAWDDLASFGHDRKRTWLLMFEEAGRETMHFDDEALAHEVYERASLTWNCTLFETARRRR